jgi:rfaE bifunctional protein nucleotidyltransferase chain/domain
MTDWYKMVEGKIIEPTHLPEFIQKLRGQKKTIATLNGSFDILHPGHLFMIFEAAKCGDALLLLLNSDDSIKSYKGKNRPYSPLKQRLMMIAALSEVSFVSWFEETDPRAILEIIKPDVHVNGAEYGPDCIEAEVVRTHGGRLHLVPRIGDFATTKLIEKLCV